MTKEILSRSIDAFISRNKEAIIRDIGTLVAIESVRSEPAEGAPYGIPINYVWDGNDHIYLHCAPTGRKLQCIGQQAEVSFCVVGRTNVVPHKFTTGYESVVIKCQARTGLSAEERMNALRLLLEKYSPNDLVIGLKYAEKSFHRTEIICLDLKEFSGKQKKVN